MPAEDSSLVGGLEAEVRRLRALLECAPDFIARVSLDGTFLDLNHLSPGFQRGDVIGASVFVYIPEAFHERARAAIKAAIETRSVQHYQTVGPTSADSVGYYLTRVSPIIEDGSVTSLVMTATNVTVLEEQRLLLQIALDATGLGTFNFDISRGSGAWDAASLAIFGLAGDDATPTLERFYREFLHPEDLAAVEAELSRSLETSHFGPIEYRVRTHGGAVRWVSAAGVAVRDPAGQSTSLIGTMKDVTDLRALEARLRDAEKLEGIGRLAGGIAHDFNNMLTAIIGNLSLASSMSTLEEVRPLLDEAQLAAKRSAALTAQLLAFARRQVVEPKVLAPAALIRRLEPLLRRLLDERTEVVVTLEASGHVRIGESQLEQVVMNLVTNARDALPHGGRVEIGTRDVTIDATTLRGESGVTSGRYVLIIVSDDGTGIAAEHMPHLFEPFFTTREGGTGLGLATSYGIVHQAGGTINVESGSVRGSTFYVYLPRVEPLVSASPPQPSMPPSGVRAKVLVVEDEDPVRQVLERTFRGGNFSVDVAASAEEALHIAEQHGPFDVVVSDVVMPGMDGVELSRRLREKWPTLRVLLISGYTHDFPFKGEPQDPNVGFLQKPFQPNDILRAVRNLCDGSGASSEQRTV